MDEDREVQETQCEAEPEDRGDAETESDEPAD